MSRFFNLYRHLLPSGRAWQLTIDKVLRRYIEGLAGWAEDWCEFVDRIYLDMFAETTRDIELWEQELGIFPVGSEVERRNAIGAALQATGGQSPAYIEGVLRAAGFDLKIHEWWASTKPYVPRDPRDYALPPRIGTVQCRATNTFNCRATNPFRMNQFLSGNPGYFANLDLTPRPPPPIPSDPMRWRFFLYIGGPTIDDIVTIDRSKRRVLERLIQKHKPAQQWVVVRVQYV